jgi:hypothetical protein
LAFLDTAAGCFNLQGFVVEFDWPTPNSVETGRPKSTVSLVNVLDIVAIVSKREAIYGGYSLEFARFCSGI